MRRTSREGSPRSTRRKQMPGGESVAFTRCIGSSRPYRWTDCSASAGGRLVSRTSTIRSDGVENVMGLHQVGDGVRGHVREYATAEWCSSENGCVLSVAAARVSVLHGRGGESERERQVQADSEWRGAAVQRRELFVHVNDDSTSVASSLESVRGASVCRGTALSRQAGVGQSFCRDREQWRARSRRRRARCR